MIFLSFLHLFKALESKHTGREWNKGDFNWIGESFLNSQILPIQLNLSDAVSEFKAYGAKFSSGLNFLNT